MRSERSATNWKETIGMIDAILENREPDSRVSWVDRYGRMKAGAQHIFALKAEDPSLTHESVLIAEAEIGVQKSSYSITTGKFNQITYSPAYRFTRSGGGLAVASVIIARSGKLTVPLTQNFRTMLKPQDIIDDIHRIMYED